MNALKTHYVANAGAKIRQISGTGNLFGYFFGFKVLEQKKTAKDFELSLEDTIARCKIFK